jgi:hypothetical protein
MSACAEAPRKARHSTVKQLSLDPSATPAAAAVALASITTVLKRQTAKSLIHYVSSCRDCLSDCNTRPLRRRAARGRALH